MCVLLAVQRIKFCNDASIQCDEDKCMGIYIEQQERLNTKRESKKKSDEWK